MEKLQNNLFTYATSELSQDAFLCWLISFADSTAEKDSHLQSCARKFLCTAIPALEDETINKIKINKQYKHIDALITINEKYELIIEDKTYTEEHNNQLHRYTKEIEDEFTDKGFKIKGLYYKIGFQSDYSAIQDAGYEIIDRSTMLEILNPFKEKIKNQIWQDYYEFLDDFEKKVQEFKTEAVKNWTWYQVYGFYDDLQKSNFLKKECGLGWSKYGYVANSAGGIDAMWCGSNAIISVLTKAFGNMPYELYLQLEFKNINILEHSVDFRICLKTSLQGDKRGNSDMYSEVRDYLREKYEKTHNDKVFKRPSRLGNGIAMTIGEYKIPEEDKLADIKDKIRKAVEDYKKFTASFFFDNN